MDCSKDPPKRSVGLHWKDKSPCSRIPHADFKLKEIYGIKKGGWINKLYCGDNLEVMSRLQKEYKGAVDLVYIDPPFYSKAVYKRKITVRGRRGLSFFEAQYDDNWEIHEYLQFMYLRLIAIKDLLSKKGVLYVHCDHRQVHHLKCLLDEVYGENRFLNQITWRRQVPRGMKAHARYYAFSSDYLLIYSKTDSPTWHRQIREKKLTLAEARNKYRNDGKGFFRTSDPGTYSFESLLALHAKGRLYAPRGGEVVVQKGERLMTASKGGKVSVKYYREERDGFVIENETLDNIWNDVPGMGVVSSEFTGYPTQKPERLLERVISASTNPGDLVLDCFLGSGTAAVVAENLGRRFLGIDLNDGAIETTIRRLLSKNGGDALGFEVYRSDEGKKENAQADLLIEDGKLIIKDFRPKKLLGRLSSLKAIWEDWRSLVDAVMIDWNYDGHVLRPDVMDIPCGKDKVAGVYDLPYTAGKVRVKITDLLSKSFEAEITP